MINEDYGWEIKPEEAFEKLDEVEHILGTDLLLSNLVKAMGTEKLAELLAYICRQYDLKEVVDGAEEPEEFMDFDDSDIPGFEGTIDNLKNL